MPLNTLRLNYQPSSHPNDRIVFIKPIPRPTTQRDEYDRAELVLKAIAAQCLPVMKDHYLSVTTLEEYEPNPEFIGRNFNNGEIIQLVIRSKSGAWLPLKMIQMVMMHELAHNTHMNHGKGFWQTRNTYAGEMRSLWSKGYTGEGLWGQGRTLQSVHDAIGGNVLQSEELADLPLCGGTFRSRRKKRKLNKPELTWKERRDKRIEKKFGRSGEKLGENEDARLMLEISRKGPIGGKPRVAQSKRGRELRAAAALARFETNKEEVKKLDADVKQEPYDDDGGIESEGEYEEVDGGQDDAIDHLGRKMTDSHGRNMIRICGEEDEDDVEVKREMEELTNLEYLPTTPADGKATAVPGVTQRPVADARLGLTNDPHIKQKNEVDNEVRRTAPTKTQVKETTLSASALDTDRKLKSSQPVATDSTTTTTTGSSTRRSDIQCPVCSLTNDSIALNCVACAHVLDTRKDPRHWRCVSDMCKDGIYVNAGDCGICGVCGTKKLTTNQPERARQEGKASEPALSSHIAYI